MTHWVIRILMTNTTQLLINDRQYTYTLLININESDSR